MAASALEKNNDKIKAYDFKSNILLQPDELKSIKLVTETFAELLSLSFSARLTEPFTAKYRETVVNRLGQIAKNLISPVVSVKMNIDGLEGEAFFQYERAMMFMLVDGFLGGDSKPNAKSSEEITAFEEKIIKKISERLVHHFEMACQKNAKVTTEIKDVITRIDNFEISNPEDLMMTIKLDFIYGGITSVFSMAFPSYIMEPMLKKAPKKNSGQDKKTTGVAAMQPYKYEKMKDVKIDCSVVLSNLKIKLKDIIDVQIGDCIKLEQDIYKPLEIKFGGSAKYTGMPGLRGRKMAVKVTGIIKGGTNGRD